ncbi:MAG TPA: transglycosylase domain-containing protein [Polyangia bacterium]|nr:transglycosylase domain-containing protein [Polyangia bacterium]
MLRRPLVWVPLVATAIFAGGPLAGEWLVRARVLPKVSARLGRNVTVNDVKVGFGTLELRGLVVDGAGAAPPVVIPGLRAKVALSSLLAGAVHVEMLELDRPRVDVVRSESGDDNVSSILDKLRERKAGASEGGGGGGKLHVDLVRIHSGNVRLTDDTLGQAEVKALDGDLRPDGPATLHVRDARLEAFGARAGADEATVDVTLAHNKPVGLPTIDVKNGTLTPVRGLELTGIRATVRPDADGQRQDIDVHGSYGGASTELWNASGYISADAREGKLTLRCDRFKLSQLDSVLRNKDGTPEILNASKGEMDAHLDLGFRDEKLAFIGAAHMSGLTIAHPMLAPQPVPHLGFDARIKGVVETKERTLKLSEAAIDFRNLHAVIAADVANLGRKPRFAATLQVRPLPCQTALSALPVELVPYLQGFKLAGTFSTDLHLGLDLEDLDTPVDLGGHVGIEGCRVTQAPEWSSSDRLMATFEQTVNYEPGKWMTFFVGPESPDWVPFSEISPHLINSIMTTEDSGFFKHHGFISSEFRSALQQNLQRGYFRLGASSITMQMIKNVLLSREKTLSRKLQEMFLTWYVEHHLTKERIMEIYFNVIEFGPGIYGIGRAARHYFGKSAKELQPQEAAWFSSILPNPKKRYVQYCHANGMLDAKWDAYIKRIMRRMHERGRLTDEEFATAQATPLRFSRTEAMPERECMAFVKRITTPPQQLAQSK